MRYAVSDEIQKWAAGVWGRLEPKLNAECRRLGAAMPYIPVDGRYEELGERSLTWWTNGFYSGMMWQMYHATGQELYSQAAIGVEERLDQALAEYTKLDHDLGFLWLHTAVADYRLTKNETSRARGLHAASLLAGRYHPIGGYIQAWNGDREGWAIIDCLMNLPLLYWASDELHDSALRHMAITHTDMALNYLLRPDGSCNHVVVFDPATGTYLDNPGGQGYASGSSWSRGQSWAIYGMALAYRYTKKLEYLDAAKRAAHYFCASVSLTGYVPVIDFRAPKEPQYYDTTAGVCAACGLLELSEYVGDMEKALYVDSAVQMLKAVDERFCYWDVSKDSIVSHGSARYDRESDREVPIIYGDYFFTEGILRLLDKDFLIW